MILCFRYMHPPSHSVSSILVKRNDAYIGCIRCLREREMDALCLQNGRRKQRAQQKEFPQHSKHQDL
jgi:hypothetical protein